MSGLLPHGATDTHLHVYDARYPVSPEAVVLAADALPDEYLAVAGRLGIDRAVLVQASAYGLDNRCQLAAMAEFEAAGVAARGVMVVDSSTGVEELHRLHDLGVRGARFHMLPGGAVGWEHLAPVAERIAPLGWHIQLQLDGHRLPDVLDRITGLPCPLVIDHVGRFMPPPAVDSEPAETLLGLVDRGSTWVKLSAPYESAADRGPDFTEVTAIIDELVRRRPDRLLWASNWPHPGQPDPLTERDLTRLLERWVPIELRHQILVDNPAALYDF